MTREENARALEHLIEKIDAFDRKTDDEEYTDTGDIWNMLYEIRATLRSVVESLRS